MLCDCFSFFSFFFNDTATTEIYTLSLHDALPLFSRRIGQFVAAQCAEVETHAAEDAIRAFESLSGVALGEQRDDVRMTLVAKRRLDRISAADHLRAVLLREV